MPAARDISLDILKTLLVTGMVIGHTLQFLGDNAPGSAGYYFSEWINFVTFSGFYFCFGQTSYLAYLSKPDVNPKRILRNAGRILIAFYIAAFSFKIIYSGLCNISDVKSLILTGLLYNIPILTEFLLSFAGLNLLIYIYIYIYIYRERETAHTMRSKKKLVTAGCLSPVLWLSA